MIPEQPRETFSLSIAQVHRINAWRMQYIVVYFVWLAIQVYVTVLMPRDFNPGVVVVVAASIAVTAAILFFWYRFVSVLRAMRFSAMVYVPAAIVSLLPIPGVLIVAYLDRSIGRVLRKGLEAAEARAE